MSSARLLPIALALLAAGCGSASDEPGVVRYANGEVWTTSSLVGGRPDGEWRSFWPSGQPKSLETWRDGRLDGPFESWFADGRTRSKGTYRENRRDGEWSVWHAAGPQMILENWDNGVLEGPSRGWFASGDPAHVAEYRDGVLVGVHEQWWDNGHPRLWIRHPESEDEPIHRKMWHEDGTPRYDGMILGSVPHGEQRLWGDDGELDPAVSGVFEHGKRVGDLPEQLR